MTLDARRGSEGFRERLARVLAAYGGFLQEHAADLADSATKVPCASVSLHMDYACDGSGLPHLRMEFEPVSLEVCDAAWGVTGEAGE